jgi:hypothetical protein
MCAWASVDGGPARREVTLVVALVRSRKSVDDADELFFLIALPTGEPEQFAATHDHLAQARGFTDDRDSPTTAKLQDSFIPQLPQGPEHRVLIHTHHRREVTSWWQSLSRFDLSIRYFTSQFCRYPRVDG